MVYDAGTGYLIALAGGSYINVVKVSADGIKLVQSLDTRSIVQDLFLNPKTHTVLGISRRVDEDVFAMAQPPAAYGNTGGTVLTLTLRQ